MSVEQKLGAFVLGLMTDAQAARKSGMTLEDVQRGLEKALVGYAREHGLIADERDLPRWQCARCPHCTDGWAPSTRMVRGELVEAYTRCSCQAVRMSDRQDDRAKAAEKVARGW